MDKPSNVFIVGVGRSGTKFLKNVLNRHPQIHISSETHFFSTLAHNGFIKTANKIGDLHRDENVKILVDRMFAKEIFGSFWKGNNLTNKEGVRQKFLASDRSFKSLFQIVLDEDRNKRHKLIGGEKTPSHLYHVDTIMEWFPGAKILHILRNPKDVLLSDIYKDVKPDYPVSKNNFFYNIGIFLAIAYNWNKAVQLDEKYKKNYPENYLLIRYEDLLNDHKNCVLKVCNFLNVEFNENMLNPPLKDSSFNTTHKKEARARHYRFKNSFESIINKILGRKMSQYGYYK